MITDEEIKRVAVESGFELVFGKYLTKSEEVFARAIYQLGRQHQRESDAALCKTLINSISDVIVIGEDRRDGGINALTNTSNAILANTGELK